MSNTLAVRAVRTRTFLTPDGRYTVELDRPRHYSDAHGWVVVDWRVLVSNPNRTRVIVARGQEMMPPDVAQSTVDAMLRVLPDAWRHRVGTWRDDPGFDLLTRLSEWATYRRDARQSAGSASAGTWGGYTPARGVRVVRAAWGRRLGWPAFSPGYVDGLHLRKPNNDNPNN